ncbi:MAG: hypothetical protein MJZ12_00095 [Prevotella sp.]|nr:hypothetical protein [Prevotella sp.]
MATIEERAMMNVMRVASDCNESPYWPSGRMKDVYLDMKFAYIHGATEQKDIMKEWLYANIGMEMTEEKYLEFCRTMEE